jgi:hypothetical protein
MTRYKYKLAIVAALLSSLAACGGGGGTQAPATSPSSSAPAPAPPSAGGDLTRVSGKTPVNLRAEALAGLVGTYSSQDCVDSATSTIKPGVIDVSSNGVVTVNGGVGGNLFDPNFVVSIQRSDLGNGTGTSFMWLRDANSAVGPHLFQVAGPTVDKGRAGFSVSAWTGGQRVSCFVPGNLNSLNKPAFFAVQKYLEVDVKDWFCVDGVNKSPPVIVSGAYKNKGGEAVLGGEALSASSNLYLERIAIEPPNSPDAVVPNRGQGLVYSLQTKGGRFLAAFHNDAGELIQVSAVGAATATSPPTNPYMCRQTSP